MTFKPDDPTAIAKRNGKTSADRRRRERKSAGYRYAWREALAAIRQDAELLELTPNHLLDLWQRQFRRPLDSLDVPHPTDPDDFHLWMMEHVDAEQ